MRFNGVTFQLSSEEMTETKEGDFFIWPWLLPAVTWAVLTNNAYYAYNAYNAYYKLSFNS